MKNIFYACMILMGISSMNACKNSASEIRAMNELDSIVSTEYAEGVQLNYTDSGLLKAILYAPVVVKVDSESEPYTEMPKGVKADFYDKDHNIESTIKSKYARSDDKTKIVEARNSVEVVNEKGEKLESEQLYWDQLKKQIYTDKFVKITTKNQILTGKGMRANENFTKWTILQTSGEFEVDDDKQMDSTGVMDDHSSSNTN